MTVTAYTDRRREKAKGWRAGRPAFINIPKAIAAPAIIFATLIALAADHVSPAEIWYGPAYLLICAFAAWFVGARIAIVLGLTIMVFQVLAGNGYPHGAGVFTSDFALRFFCVLTVVLMLGQARMSLEREWQLARTDPLTGALNRQAFFEAIKADAGHEGSAMLVFADVDGLKCVNDEMGHEKGDEGLRDLANRVSTAIRKEDLFARIGGDEFVIFMKVRDQAAAMIVADRLNAILNLTPLGSGGRFRCSLGILYLPTGSRAIDVELNLADKLMYSAKKASAGFAMKEALPGEGRKLVTLLPEVPSDTSGEAGDPDDSSPASGLIPRNAATAPQPARLRA